MGKMLQSKTGEGTSAGKSSKRHMSAAASIWFEIWGSWIRVNKISIFPGTFLRNFDFFSGNFTKNFNFWKTFEKFQFFRQICKKFDFIQAMFKKFRFSAKHFSFTATSEQIILFLFKSDHFRTYFLCMIRYNDISRPNLRPPRPHNPKSGVVAIPQTPRI